MRACPGYALAWQSAFIRMQAPRLAASPVLACVADLKESGREERERERERERDHVCAPCCNCRVDHSKNCYNHNQSSRIAHNFARKARLSNANVESESLLCIDAESWKIRRPSVVEKVERPTLLYSVATFLREAPCFQNSATQKGTRNPSATSRYQAYQDGPRRPLQWRRSGRNCLVQPR
jgi:hypothetical protein